MASDNYWKSWEEHSKDDLIRKRVDAMLDLPNVAKALEDPAAGISRGELRARAVEREQRDRFLLGANDAQGEYVHAFEAERRWRRELPWPPLDIAGWFGSFLLTYAPTFAVLLLIYPNLADRARDWYHIAMTGLTVGIGYYATQTFLRGVRSVARGRKPPVPIAAHLCWLGISVVAGGYLIFYTASHPTTVGAILLPLAEGLGVFGLAWSLWILTGPKGPPDDLKARREAALDAMLKKLDDVVFEFLATEMKSAYEAGAQANEQPRRSP